MAKTDVKISGFGGQGVILSAHILGKAASIFDRKHATMTQAFGPEARGSSCSAQVIISDEVIRYPYVKHPEILVSMSQEAFAKFSPEVADGGMVLIDEDLVKAVDLGRGIRVVSIPATRYAEELGRKLVLNIVMFGFFTAMSGLVDKESALKAVLDSVPKGTEELNSNAFNKGYDHGLRVLEENPDLRAAAGKAAASGGAPAKTRPKAAKKTAAGK